MSMVLVYASIPVVALSLSVGLALAESTIRIFLLVSITEFLLILTIGIDNFFLKKKSSVATFRRLSAVSIVSNSLWELTGVIAVILFLLTADETRFFSLIILGAFFAIGFRMIVFGAVFYSKPEEGIPLSIAQPLILLFSQVASASRITSVDAEIISAISGGLIFLLAIDLYLRSINKPVEIGKLKAFGLLQAFLNAWTIQDADKMEGFLQDVSKQRSVSTTLIDLEGKDKKISATLIVPGIHPGPFYPIGSSNLPGDIFLKLRTANRIPLTFHSISDHELNLPSREEVQNYLRTLSETKRVDQGDSISDPIARSKNKATVAAFALGKTLVIALTQAPYGMEDFPVEVRVEIESAATRAGFLGSFVIDCHNSEGAKPDEKECRDMVDVSKVVIGELAACQLYNFRFGFAHSSELNLQSIPADVGPAGIGLLYFDIERTKTEFCLAISDSNNAKIGFREMVQDSFLKKDGIKLLEICTSDTHVTAARTIGGKGYLALGDVSSPEKFASILDSLYPLAKSRTDYGSFSTLQATSLVRTIGSEILDNFSGLLDKTTSAAKVGGGILLALGVLLIGIVAAI